MNNTPCRERTFRVSLADAFAYHYWYNLLWLKTLLERLGREPTLPPDPPAPPYPEPGAPEHHLSCNSRRHVRARTLRV